MPSTLTKLTLLPLACSLPFLGGCTNFIPQDGPDAAKVTAHAASTSVATKPTTDLPYALIQVDSARLALLRTSAHAGGFHFSAPDSDGNGKIGIGDVLDISIFEADTGGLFTASPSDTRLGNAITLPSQEVDQAGLVTVPFAGHVRAAGQTAAQLASAIVAKLKAQALDPQVVVGFAARHSGSISVLGDVNLAAHFCLDSGGEHLLGALARAGGPKSPDYETHIELERGGFVGDVRLSDITSNPDQDIAIAPGDTIYVSHRPDYFIALGATGQSVSLGPVDRRITFGSAHLTLVDALARAGGLQDDRANPTEVFVFRYENESTFAALGGRTVTSSAKVPVVYVVNLRDPTGLFYASQFEIRPEDIVYAADASATDASKVESLLMPLVDTAVTAAVWR